MPWQRGQGCPSEVKAIWMGCSQYLLNSFILLLLYGILTENIQTANGLKSGVLKLKSMAPKISIVSFRDYVLLLQLFTKYTYMKWTENKEHRSHLILCRMHDPAGFPSSPLNFLRAKGSSNSACSRKPSLTAPFVSGAYLRGIAGDMERGQDCYFVCSKNSNFVNTLKIGKTMK